MEPQDLREASESGDERVLAWWFGGGSDLMPTYLHEDDALQFFETLKAMCGQHCAALHPELKQWCDEHFYIPHRQEHRGIGGVFFHDLSDIPHRPLDSKREISEQRPRAQKDIFAFIKSLGDAFLPSYLPIIERRTRMSSNGRGVWWQQLRRERYVEFNPVCDAGAKFGLSTPGVRIESNFMGMPELVRWEYMSYLGQDEETEEGRVMQVLKHPREWV